MGRLNEKRCEDCGQETQKHFMSRCNACQKIWEEKNQRFSSETEEKKVNTYEVQHLFFSVGYSASSIAELMGISEKEVKKILGIGNKNE